MDNSPTRAERLLSLLRAVEALALPHAVTTTQFKPGGKEVTSIVHAPLITSLRDAAYGSGGSGSGASGSDPRTRSMLDLTAMKDYVELETHIQYAWTILIPYFDRIPATWPLEQALALWAELFIPLADQDVSPIPDDIVESTAETFAGWRSKIQQYFTPPKVVTNHRPCPSCSATRYTTEDGVDAPHPIIMFAGKDLEHSRARCRACNHEWAGEEELDQLRRDQTDIAVLLTPEGTPERVSDTPPPQMPTEPIRTAVA